MLVYNEGTAGGGAYGATKATLDAMSELGSGYKPERGARINTVASGPVYTSIQPPEQSTAAGASTRLDRAAQPEEVAEAVALLASPGGATSPSRRSPPAAAGPRCG